MINAPQSAPPLDPRLSLPLPPHPVFPGPPRPTPSAKLLCSHLSARPLPPPRVRHAGRAQVEGRVVAEMGAGLCVRVAVEGRVVAEIGAGLCVLVGVMAGDGEQDCDYIQPCRTPLAPEPFTCVPTLCLPASLCVQVSQRGYEVLLVSQFTLYGQPKGNKLDFHVAMPPQEASSFYNDFVHRVRRAYHPDRVKDGIFGAMMEVSGQGWVVGGNAYDGRVVGGVFETSRKPCTLRPSTADGIFGAIMEVHIANSGPVTLFLDSRKQSGTDSNGGNAGNGDKEGQ
ncbi:unnamed protein product [Closterium sp. NIES-64]|nr:unnamed protein product [Closterium sp. NIES-64]